MYFEHMCIYRILWIKFSGLCTNLDLITIGKVKKKVYLYKTLFVMMNEVL